MTQVSFFGGIEEIGGNIILLETEDSRILFDFGKNFKQESKFFSEFLNPRKSHGLEDFIELGLLPDLDGVYRKDYLNHIGREAQEEPSVDAIFITHAHMDHIGYLHFLRGDIPVYCTHTTEVLMESIQESGNYTFSEFVDKKKEFHLREKSNGGLTRLSRRDSNYDSVGREPVVDRDIHTVEDGESVEIGDVEVECLRVNHSLPGAAGFLMDTPDSTLAYTGDVRLHGYKSENTRNFIDEATRADALITEGTNVGKKHIPTEEEVEDEIEEFMNEEDDSIFINFPPLDLERLRSAVLAAEEAGRKMVIRTKQALLLKKLEEKSLLPFPELSLSNEGIQILMPQKGWGTLMHEMKTPEGEWKSIDGIDGEEKDLEKISKRDYHKWEKQFMDRDDSVTPKDIRGELGSYVVYMDYYRLKDLIDFDPEGGSFIWSRTEPFNASMELDQKRVQNWLEHFNLDMRKAHASGHISQPEIREMIESIDPEKLFAIHTEEPEWFRRFALDTPEVEYGKSYSP